MSGINFHETPTGNRFFNATVPAIAKSLSRIADSLEALAAPAPTAMEEQITYICYCINVDYGTAADLYATTVIEDAQAWVTRIYNSLVNDRGFRPRYEGELEKFLSTRLASQEDGFISLSKRSEESRTIGVKIQRKEDA